MRSTTIRPSCFALRRTYDRHLAADRGVVRAAMDRTLQVVLGEAEADDGFLRFVLEGERGLAPAAPPEEARPESPRLDRSTRGVLVAALTWILVLTTLATIAVGVPGALDVFAQRSPHRPTPSAPPSTPSPSPDPVSRPGTDIRSTGGSGCERPACRGTGNGQPTKKKKMQTHPGPETGTPGSQAQAGQGNAHHGTEQGQANANDNGATHIPPAPGEGSPGQDVKEEAIEGGLKERRQGAGSDPGSSHALV